MIKNNLLIKLGITTCTTILILSSFLTDAMAQRPSTWLRCRVSGLK